MTTCPICGTDLQEVKVSESETVESLTIAENEGYWHPMCNTRCPHNFSFITLEQLEEMIALTNQLESLDDSLVSLYEIEDIFV